MRDDEEEEEQPMQQQDEEEDAKEEKTKTQLPNVHHLRRRDHEIIVEQLQHRQNLEDQKQTWRSCCLYMDRRAVIYFAQLIFCIAVSIFCASQLALYPEPQHAEGREKYVLLLGLMCGFELGLVSASSFVPKQ